jgi:hypothetical protein
MSESMTRLESGDYQIVLGEDEYRVIREVTRVETGRSSRGRVETTWRAFRGTFLLAETDSYKSAKKICFEDSRTPVDQRPQPVTPSLSDSEFHTDDVEQPSLWQPTDQTEDSSDMLNEWEYPQGEGSGTDDTSETPIGGMTVMEKRYSYSG